MITTPQELAQLKTLPPEHLVGLVVQARLNQSNAEHLLRDAHGREQRLRAVLGEFGVILPDEIIRREMGGN